MPTKMNSSNLAFRISDLISDKDSFDIGIKKCVRKAGAKTIATQVNCFNASANAA